MLSEFDLIYQYFASHRTTQKSVALGVGDDCALLQPAPGQQMAISSDMLVEGRHFFAGENPERLGHKALAVNLSDLAAMGAKPVGFTLAFSLPEANAEWLAGFSKGLLRLADRYQCQLIGGDTTKGPLNICITVFGEIPPGQALRRDAAKAGDDIWVSGTLGDARLALAAYLGEITLSDELHEQAANRMHLPEPRVTLGLALRGIAHAALDISDGLCGDLGHILKRSQLGARLNCDALPAGPVLRQQTPELQRQFCLAGGDDYELCFTAAPDHRADVLRAAELAQTPVTRIGTMTASPGLVLTDASDEVIELAITSFDHFRSP
ncbi:thiamine-phosphate kinase [Undibacterium luofuense]|uniref:Thiamine-monophosphate kinase n=1 Tax=Undibacterium luofuense TaxID=2828733 RepID=A0A941I8F0_9BURK|nr:thiamine-phosphate kinase [Undibacterium luofuense]MBR7783685.1 thiamine-phosphate kinase [Undibacterium luofuense]